LKVFSLAKLPLFSLDVEEAGAPEPVQAFQNAVRESHGIVICSSEYNHGTSGTLKNALDWGSRPQTNCPLKGKPSLIDHERGPRPVLIYPKTGHAPAVEHPRKYVEDLRRFLDGR
jgi:NAD(P)H-dependent FMN reductase